MLVTIDSCNESSSAIKAPNSSGSEFVFLFGSAHAAHLRETRTSLAGLSCALAIPDSAVLLK